MPDAGIGNGNKVSTSASSSAEGRAYGASTGGNVYNYGEPVTLGGLLGDTKSMVIAGVILLLVLRHMKKKG